MLTRYVLADLRRNVRRTLTTTVAVALGVGLFCAVLFFVDGLSVSMTQRAVAPLPIDMQRIVTERAGGALRLTQRFEPSQSLRPGDAIRVVMRIENPQKVSAHEVTIRSTLAPGLTYVQGSATIDGRPLGDADGSPFAHGPARLGHNLGTVEPNQGHTLTFRATADQSVTLDDATVATTFSSREVTSPVGANQASGVGLADLARQIQTVPGVSDASELSIGDLGLDALHGPERTAGGPARIFGFDEGYAARDRTITVVRGELTRGGAVVSAETATRLGLAIGDMVGIDLPDGSRLTLPVTGSADVSRSRALFSSRRGGDLETFIYTPNAVVVSPAMFASRVFPAFERAAVAGGGRLKTPPIREIDIALDRGRLNAEPATASEETRRIGESVMAIVPGEDYLLDNITNTLSVAAADAQVAKKLFIFLGLPGALLAAMLAAYAGHILAEAERRENATLRIRGASRRHLLRMLMARTALLTGAGAVVGLTLGYLTASIVLGQESLGRVSVANLIASSLIGTIGGFVATGLALYLTGRRSIDHEINADRARLADRTPLWRRFHLDAMALLAVIAGTIWALATHAFDGAPGSVYFGRGVELNLVLLALPIVAWIAGSLLTARLVGAALDRSRPGSSARLSAPERDLYRRSVGRRPWAIGNAALILALIVALATSLASFTASYDAAKIHDARYANGADIRITPAPTSRRTYSAGDAEVFRTGGVRQTTPVISGPSNVVLRSARTSDPANLAAIDVASFSAVAPLDAATAAALEPLAGDAGGVLVSADMASFLQVEPGDTINVLLARSTPEQVEIETRVTGLFERLPGFPDGADAVMSIAKHTAAVPTKAPDFFLASTDGTDALDRAVAELRSGPAARDDLHIETRASTLDRDQSSLAALNVDGLVRLDSGFALGMTVVAIATFVFGLLLQRRREYVTLRALGLEPRSIRLMIAAEAATVAVAGSVAGLIVGAAMGSYFVRVLRPLFVLDPATKLPPGAVLVPVLLVVVATVCASVVASRMVNRLQPTELLRDE